MKSRDTQCPFSIRMRGGRAREQSARVARNTSTSRRATRKISRGKFVWSAPIEVDNVLKEPRSDRPQGNVGLHGQPILHHPEYDARSARVDPELEDRLVIRVGFIVLPLMT